jgi:hypothetical protein
MSQGRPDKVTAQESLGKMRREREALDRAKRYMFVDPFYRDNNVMTPREEAIAHLALRAYTHPDDTEIATISLEIKAEGDVRLRRDLEMEE